MNDLQKDVVKYAQDCFAAVKKGGGSFINTLAVLNVKP